MTKSGVNTKNIIITNEAVQQKLTGKTADQTKSEIHTDLSTENAREHSDALDNVFDKERVQKEIERSLKYIIAKRNELNSK